MKKTLMIATTALFISFSSVASASELSKSPTPNAAIPGPAEISTDADSQLLAARTGPVRNILRGLLELERRKNAWLRRTFLRA